MPISGKRRGSFWRAPRLRFDDLPTYGELLRQADAKLLAKVILAGDLGVGVGELPKGKHAKKERGEIEKTIREMRDIDETRSDEDVLVAARRASGSGSGRPEVRVAAELVVRKDLPHAAEVLAAESSWYSTYAGWRRWRERCRSGEVDAAEVPRIGTWAYELSPREEILGYRCWIGQGFSKLEKYQYLADIFGEATFFGADEEASQTAQKEIDDGIEKALEDVKSGARTVPVEVAMPDYGLAARGDDLEEEGWESTSDLCDYLNLVLQRDLHESMADLWERIEAEEETA